MNGKILTAAVQSGKVKMATIDEKIRHILMTAEQFGWLEALGPRPTIVDVLSTLLALLELAKRGTLRIVQPAAFAPMVIARDPARPS